MYCTVNNNGNLVVHTDENDLCYKCKNIYKCPLVQAFSKEYVVMRYSDIEIRDCGLFKKIADFR